ncbi:hypothetical protein B0T11DRAFT_78019 [Plectosphaerella cucumerina]|uniref:Uncharacterized protein n=1 Tax=Plectosphaerella cucumerina TaxID=40658 RepID=A0A8K0TE11_9PEZI|nr:hypothetical protein B0T11DRAFT_78019 [Plectosphaerella cucumerina]
MGRRKWRGFLFFASAPARKVPRTSVIRLAQHAPSLLSPPLPPLFFPFPFFSVPPPFQHLSSPSRALCGPKCGACRALSTPAAVRDAAIGYFSAKRSSLIINSNDDPATEPPDGLLTMSFPGATRMRNSRQKNPQSKPTPFGRDSPLHATKNRQSRHCSGGGPLVMAERRHRMSRNGAVWGPGRAGACAVDKGPAQLHQRWRAG